MPASVEPLLGHEGHGHAHGGRSETKSEANVRKLKTAVAFSLSFMVAEIIGGIMANSLAIITDAAHLLSDVGGFAISAFSIGLTALPATKKFTYGYQQAEIVGAIVSVLIIWLMTGALLISAVHRFITPEAVDGKMTFIIATLGLCVNLILMKVLGHGHSHGGGGCGGDAHGHSHGAASGHGDDGDSSNEEPAGCQGHGHRGHGGGHGGHGGGHGHDGHAHGRDIESQGHGGDCGGHGGGHGHSHGHDDGACQGHGHGSAQGGGHSHGGHGDAYAHGHGHGKGSERQPSTTGEDSHGHSHGHGGEDLAMRAAIIHVIGDMLQSAGVMCAGLLIWFKPLDVGETWNGLSKWNYADPCCTVLFGLLVMMTTYQTMISAVEKVMMATPPEINSAAVLKDIKKVPHVVSVHDLHLWSAGGSNIITCHVVVDECINCTEVLEACIKLADRKHGIGHCTFQLEVHNLFDHKIESLKLGDGNCHRVTCDPKGTCAIVMQS